MEKTIGIVYAPIEIENPGQLETLGITWKDVVPFSVGKKVIQVYLAPAPQEVCEYMLRELRKKYKQESRAGRCLVPGERKDYARCKDSHSCSACPYDRERNTERAAFVSLDELLEEGFDQADNGRSVDDIVELHELLDHLHSINPDYYRILKLRAEGYTNREVAEILGLEYYSVGHALARIRRIVRAFRETQ